jgi:cell division protein FtsB
LSRPATTRPDSLRAVLRAAVLLALALLALAAVKSHRDLAAARARERALAASIEASRGRIAALRARIVRLRDDPATLERLAREELGLVRPHDLVIELPADGPPPRRPARPQPAPPPAAR